MTIPSSGYKPSTIYLKDDFFTLLNYIECKLVKQRKFYSDIDLIKKLTQLIEKIPSGLSARPVPIIVKSGEKHSMVDTICTLRLVHDIHERLKEVNSLNDEEQEIYQVLELRNEEVTLLLNHTGQRKEPKQHLPVAAAGLKKLALSFTRIFEKI